MIALLERRQQLYWLIGVTSVAVALATLLLIQLPSDVPVNYPALYLLIALTVASGLLLLRSPQWLRDRPFLFWPIAGLLYPAVETLAVYFTGGLHSPFVVLFYFSLFFLGMIGGHRGAIFGSVIVGTGYILASVLNEDRAGASALLRFGITLASFYGIAFFAAFLGNIAWQQSRDASRRALRLAGLQAVHTALTEVQDEEDLLQRIPEELCRQLGFERALLYLIENEKLCIRSGYSKQEPERLEALMDYLREHPPRLGGSTVEAEAVRDLRPVLSSHPGADPRVSHEALIIAQSSSFAAAPLLGKDRVLGVIVADYFRKPHSISEEELILMSTFASAAGLAIVNRQLVIEAGQAEAFRQLDILKSEFLASVSHELRTPLTLVQTSAELLLERMPEGATHQQRRLVDTISRNSRRLSSFVEELLEMAQLEEGKVSLNRQIIDLRYLVNEVAQTLGLMVQEKRQVLFLDLPPEPCLAEVDRHRFEQVATNLIANASKYTPDEGEVWVRLKPDSETVTVEVEDTGPGIPADAMEHIFDKFYRAPDAAHRTKGVGLGLAISRSLVELHGSSLRVSSEPGRGSRFWFTLPLAREPEAVEYIIENSLTGME